MDGPLPLDEAIDLAFELAAELVQHLKQDKRKDAYEVQRPYEAFCGPEVSDLSEAESDVISTNSTSAFSILSDRSPTELGLSTPVVQDVGSIPELSIPLLSPNYHNQEGIGFSKTRTEQLGKRTPRSMGSNMVRGSETNRQSTVGLTGNDKITDLDCVARPPPEIDKDDELPDQGDSTMEQTSASSRSLPNRISISGDQTSTSSIGTRTDIADSHNTATTRNFNSHNTTTKTHPKTLNNSHNVTYNYVTHHHCPAHMGIVVSAAVLLGVTLSWILLLNGIPSLHEARSRL